jgi:hypothetical protein
MKRKRIIKVVKKLQKKGCKLTGKNGVFEALSEFTIKYSKTPLAASTIQTYYYADKNRPKK